MAIIPLTNGRSTIVDDADAAIASAHKWFAHAGTHTIYVRRTTDQLGLHRFLLDCPSNLQVDHINGDGLDNRRINLRTATIRQNQYNRRKSMQGSSRYKGVVFVRTVSAKPWKARITIDGKLRQIGYFADEIDAARAYDSVAREEYGDFAYLNFGGSQA